ncbi:hypothetical protein ATCC90586_010074 [Pythium insidiosum]|nr:hypothetical protein ATCC90586_010074 [Pythium insidiosum]
MDTPAFVGDGQFVGDGGATLQRLWDFARWRMIKGCPGRYIIRDKQNNPALVDGQRVTALDARALLRAALGDATADQLVVHTAQSERCVDGVQVVVFPDSGGVITYVKPSADGSDQPAAYVHTLNTASGLQRKLEGLRLDALLPAH